MQQLDRRRFIFILVGLVGIVALVGTVALLLGNRGGASSSSVTINGGNNGNGGNVALSADQVVQTLFAQTAVANANVQVGVTVNVTLPAPQPSPVPPMPTEPVFPDEARSALDRYARFEVADCDRSTIFNSSCTATTTFSIQSAKPANPEFFKSQIFLFQAQEVWCVVTQPPIKISEMKYINSDPIVSTYDHFLLIRKGFEWSADDFIQGSESGWLEIGCTNW